MKLPISGLSNPRQTAIDASGNIYIADSSHDRVIKETLSNGSYTESTVGSGLSGPLGVAVDASGNVYIADSGHGALLKETLSGASYTQSTISSSAGVPWSIAVDASGNVFAADHQTGRLLKEAPSGSSYIQSTIGTGLSQPSSVATDGTGNVYIADTGTNQVYKETLSGGAYVQSTLASGLSYPSSVTVDGNGNVYFATYGNAASPQGSQVYKLTPSNGSYVQTLFGRTTYFKVGPVYITADQQGSILMSSAFDGLSKLSSIGDFGSVAVGGSSSVLSIVFTFDSSGSISSSATLTQGTAGLDFADAGTGTCTTQGTSFIYTAGTSCSVDVTLTPRSIGTRYGSVVLRNAAKSIITTGYLQGLGSGPQITFSPATKVALPFDDVVSPFAVATDGAGSLYIAQAVSNNSPQNSVIKRSWTGNSYTAETVASGQSYPVGVAVDGAGNVYIVDQNATQVTKMSPVVGGGYVLTAAFSGMGNVEAVAVDGSGNVYIASLAAGVVKETLNSNGGYTKSVLFNNIYAFGIATDLQGNLYLATGDQVLKETLANGSYTQSIVASGLSGPHGLAVDGNGNVYIADTFASRVVKETLSGSTYTETLLAYPGNSPLGLAIAPDGNLFISSASANALLELDVTSPPSLTFPATNAGTQSSAQTITIQNNGNVALDFPIPASGNNPSISANFSLNSVGSTACPLVSYNGLTAGTLAAGAFCQLPISFAPPTDGTFTGSLVLTDTHLNAGAPNYAAQSISLLGSTLPIPTLNLMHVATQTYGRVPFTINATSPSDGVITYAVVSGPATISGTTVTLTGSGIVVLSASQAGTSTYAPATTTESFAVAQATPTLSFTPIALQTYGNPPFTISATSASDGAVTYTVVSGPATISGSTVTLTGAGTVYLSASQAATNRYKAATASTSFIVAPIVPTLSFTAIAPKTFGNPPFTVSATSASNGTVTYSVGSGPATVSGSTVTLTGAGTVILNASQAPTGNYGSATATTSFAVAQAVPSLSFAAIASQTYGNAPFTVSATSASNGAVTYSVVSGPATISGSTVTLTGTGTVVLSASQATTTNYTAATATTSFNATQGTPSLSFASIASQTYGNAPFAVSATSASSGAVTYSVVSGPATISGSTVTLTGVGTVVLSASQAADGNYKAATATTSFTVAQAVPSLSFAAIASQTYGNTPFTVSATSASSGAVTYAVVSGPATISGATVTLTGAGTVVLSASQTANGNYKAATASTSFTVAQAVPSLSFAAIASQTYGNTPFVVSATSASSGAVTYAVVSGPATISGATVTLTGAGTVVLRANQAATTNYTAATASANFTVAAQVFSVTPGSGSSSATTSRGGTATYTFSLAPSSGTIFPNAISFSVTGLPSGATATFSPTGLPAGSGATTVTLTIQISSQTAHNEHPSPGWPILPVAVALLILPWAGMKSTRKIPRLLAVFAITALSIGAWTSLTGCGGNSSSSSQTQTPKSYTMVVTATDATTGTQSSTNLTLTVQ
ncbi:hypothetical protein [Terriglobus albidus]|nr:hypothetical protein [Terriglobus albidus]